MNLVPKKDHNQCKISYMKKKYIFCKIISLYTMNNLCVVIKVVASEFPYGLKIMSRNTLSERQPDSTLYHQKNKLILTIKKEIYFDFPHSMNKQSIYGPLWGTVVSNYRFDQVGLFWHCQNVKVNYFSLFNDKKKEKTRCLQFINWLKWSQ